MVRRPVISSFLAITLFAVVFAGSASAAINACVTGGGTTLNNYNAAGNGCFQNDKIFNNFATSGTANDGDNGFPASNQISLAGLSLGTLVIPNLTGVTVRFASTEWDVCGTSTAFNPPCHNDTVTSQINFQNSITSGQPNAELTGLALANVIANGFSTAEGEFAGTPYSFIDTGFVRLDVCFGAAARIDVANFATGCSGQSGTAGFIQYSFSGSNTATITSSNSNLSNLLAPIDTTLWASRVSISLNQQMGCFFACAGAGDIEFTRFDLSYDETGVTPEPSSFLLLGGGLAGLIALRRRRKA